MENEGRRTQTTGEDYAYLGITGKLEVTGLDKVFIPNFKAILICFNCRKKILSGDVLYWCKSKIVFCKDCELTNTSCRYSKFGIWHEHIRSILK